MNVKVSPARRAAFEVLWRVATEEAFASNLLASARYDQLSREDHGLLQELTLGVLRWQAQLDFLIERYARRKLNKLDLEVVLALRLGLYQLKFLSRIPAHAALNEAVNLVKEQKRQSAAPFANAVLRAAQRESELDFAQLISDPLTRLSVETSHPLWLLKRWQARFGEPETRALALANNAAPRVAFRCNVQRASEAQTLDWLAAHEIKARASVLAPHAFVIESGSLSAQSPPVREHWVYLQDEASQLVAHLLAATASGSSPGSSIAAEVATPTQQQLKLLDVCAAPGSKTTLLASLLPSNACIIAADLHAHRLRTLQELSSHTGITNLQLIQLDATRPLPFAESFDLVLLDAPCSGLGTLQRHPEIKWRVSKTKIAELAELQTQLLAQAAQQVRPGGLLAYSVCSTEPEEGEEIVAAFRQTHTEFRDVTRERLLELGIEPAPLLTPTFGARTFPHRQNAEGFFVSLLWKRK